MEDPPPPGDRSNNPGFLGLSAQSLERLRGVEADDPRQPDPNSMQLASVPVVRRLHALSPSDDSSRARPIHEINNEGPQTSTSTAPADPYDLIQPSLNRGSIEHYAGALDLIQHELSLTGAMFPEDGFGQREGIPSGIAFTDPSSGGRYLVPIEVLLEVQDLFYFAANLCVDGRLSSLGRWTTSVEQYRVQSEAPRYMPSWIRWAGGGGLDTAANLAGQWLSRMRSARPLVGVGFPSSEFIASDFGDSFYFAMDESWQNLAIGEENSSAVAEWIGIVMHYIPVKAILLWVERQLPNQAPGEVLIWLTRAFARRGAASLLTVLLLRGGRFGDLHALYNRIPEEHQPRFRHIVSDLITQMTNRVCREVEDATEEAFITAFLLLVESRLINDIEARREAIGIPLESVPFPLRAIPVSREAVPLPLRATHGAGGFFVYLRCISHTLVSRLLVLLLDPDSGQWEILTVDQYNAAFPVPEDISSTQATSDILDGALTTLNGQGASSSLVDPGLGLTTDTLPVSHIPASHTPEMPTQSPASFFTWDDLLIDPNQEDNIPPTIPLYSEDDLNNILSSVYGSSWSSPLPTSPQWLPIGGPHETSQSHAAPGSLYPVTQEQGLSGSTSTEDSSPGRHTPQPPLASSYNGAEQPRLQTDSGDLARSSTEDSRSPPPHPPRGSLPRGRPRGTVRERMIASRTHLQAAAEAQQAAANANASEGLRRSARGLHGATQSTLPTAGFSTQEFFHSLIGPGAPGIHQTLVGPGNPGYSISPGVVQSAKDSDGDHVEEKKEPSDEET